MCTKGVMTWLLPGERGAKEREGLGDLKSLVGEDEMPTSASPGLSIPHTVRSIPRHPVGCTTLVPAHAPARAALTEL